MVTDRFASPARTCSRAGCRQPATASLSFRYATSQAWLLDLAETPDPSLYDLCPAHADALTVPRGWERVDQRTPAPPQPATETAGHAAAGGRAPAAEGRPAPHAPDHRAEHRPARPPNRYAALSAELPRLAAELAALREAADAGAVRADVDSHAPEADRETAAATPPGRTARPARPVATAASRRAGAPAEPHQGAASAAAADDARARDGAPADHAPARDHAGLSGAAQDEVAPLGDAAAARPPGLLTDELPGDPLPELEGQLALDVDLDGDAAGAAVRVGDGGAVVVPFDARRREQSAARGDAPEPVRP